MTDREKVFDAIRNCITEPKCKDCPWEDCEQIGCKRVKVPVTLLLDTLKLLKEQEPVKPIKLENWWKCPSCSGNIVYNMKYCAGCGRKVKWDG